MLSLLHFKKANTFVLEWYSPDILYSVCLEERRDQDLESLRVQTEEIEVRPFSVGFSFFDILSSTNEYITVHLFLCIFSLIIFDPHSFTNSWRYVGKTQSKL